MIPTLCQVCGTVNPGDREHCRRCQHQLMVLSGGEGEDQASFETPDDEAIALEEHLLERVSVLEEALRKVSETTRQLLAAVTKQEQGVVANQAGLLVLTELLEEKRHLTRDEWHERWRRRLEVELSALERRDRLVLARDRILAGAGAGVFEEVRRGLEEAQQALRGLDLEHAIGCLRETRKLDPGNRALASFLGESLFDLGRRTEALTCFDSVLEVDPTNYESLVLSGVALHEEGKAEAAAGRLERALEVRPDAFLPLFSLGALHARAGRFRIAADYLERAVRVEKTPEALFLLGVARVEEGRVGLAIRCLEAATEAAPDFEDAHHQLGIAYLGRGWRRKALAAFRQALRLNPRKLEYEDLVQHLADAAKVPTQGLEPDLRNLVRLGEQELRRGRPGRALEAFERALDERPESPVLLLYRAIALLHLGASDGVEDVVARILAAEPSEMVKATAYATLIQALRAAGRLSEGNDLCRRLLAEGRTSYAKTIAYYELAWNLAELEDQLEEALDCGYRALEIAPEELRAYPLAALGWIHFKRRELGPAIDFLTQSSHLGPSASTLNHLGIALLAAGREEEAKGALARARRLGGFAGALEEKMIECLRDRTRVLARPMR